MKVEEVQTVKKEYEKYIALKEKKIQSLQSVVNKSMYSYNTGLDNIKIANKLDDEVKVLMKRAKLSDNKNENINYK